VDEPEAAAKVPKKDPAFKGDFQRLNEKYRHGDAPLDDEDKADKLLEDACDYVNAVIARRIDLKGLAFPPFQKLIENNAPAELVERIDDKLSLDVRDWVSEMAAKRNEKEKAAPKTARGMGVGRGGKGAARGGKGGAPKGPAGHGKQPRTNGEARASGGESEQEEEDFYEVEYEQPREAGGFDEEDWTLKLKELKVDVKKLKKNLAGHVGLYSAEQEATKAEQNKLKSAESGLRKKVEDLETEVHALAARLSAPRAQDTTALDAANAFNNQMLVVMSSLSVLVAILIPEEPKPAQPGQPEPAMAAKTLAARQMFRGIINQVENVHKWNDTQKKQFYIAISGIPMFETELKNLTKPPADGDAN
jgi:hypothetical protein